MLCNFCGNKMKREEDYCPSCGRLAIRELRDDEIVLDEDTSKPLKDNNDENIVFSNPYISERDEYFKPSKYSYGKSGGSKNKISIILISILLIALVGGGIYYFMNKSSGSPIDPVKGYITALGNGKIKEAMDYTNFKQVAGNDKIGDTMLKTMENEMKSGGLSDVFKVFATMVEDAEYEVVNEAKDTAMVRMKINFMGQNQTGEFKVVKVEGEWKIDLAYGMKKV